MFGKRKKKKEEKKKNNIRMTVMPDIFYGGKDPVVYHKQTSDQTQKASLKKPKKKSTGNMPILNKKVLIIVGFVFLLTIGGISWYYINQARPAKPAKVVVVEPTPEVDPPVPEELEPVAPEPIVPEPEPEPVVAERPLVFPRILLSDSSDLDVDSLTDVEEELFGTDTGIWDTDEDGYFDGQEVLNLYNPAGVTPVKIIDSGLVREYVSPLWSYRIYYPSSWEAAAIDDTGDQVLFSSITGDFVEVRAFRKSADMSFAQWFNEKIAGQRFGDLLPITNLFGVDLLRRKDNLVAYLPGDTEVFVIVYQASSSATDVPFRHVMQMMTQSFRPARTALGIPDQVELPPAPDLNDKPDIESDFIDITGADEGSGSLN